MNDGKVGTEFCDAFTEVLLRDAIMRHTAHLHKRTYHMIEKSPARKITVLRVFNIK